MVIFRYNRVFTLFEGVQNKLYLVICDTECIYVRSEERTSSDEREIPARVKL